LEFNVPFQHKYGYIRDEHCVTKKVMTQLQTFCTLQWDQHRYGMNIYDTITLCILNIFIISACCVHVMYTSIHCCKVLSVDYLTYCCLLMCTKTRLACRLCRGLFQFITSTEILDLSELLLKTASSGTCLLSDEYLCTAKFNISTLSIQKVSTRRYRSQ